jgi:hypothetical protein
MRSVVYGSRHRLQHHSLTSLQLVNPVLHIVLEDLVVAVEEVEYEVTTTMVAAARVQTWCLKG